MGMLRIFVCSIVSVVLLVLSGVALKWGIGHSLLEPWYNQSTGAAAQAKYLEKNLTKSGISEIRTAISLQDRADAHELLGHFQLTAAYWENGSYEALVKAKTAFEAAIERRPSFVYSWAYLAAVKYRMGEVDSRFHQALENSINLGPWEPKVHALVADYGLAVLEEVPKSLKRQILDQVARGTLQNGDLMIGLATKRGKLGQVCALQLSSRIKARCNELNISPVSSSDVTD